MQEALKAVQARYVRKGIPDFRPGDIVRVTERVREGERERSAVFEGLVIARKHGRGLDGTFTVRRVIEGIGVERSFPLHLPTIEKITIVRRTKVRRAKLYYVRKQLGRRVRRRKELAVPETKAAVEPEAVQTQEVSAAPASQPA
ncbi:MAG: 50S ribosomal protein L19 [bacterium]|nr:50S ribosomal protein L19 [bacterium]MDZ4296350.1 50S ribosomal protein L19 [Patescibacteria group bacterium]